MRFLYYFAIIMFFSLVYSLYVNEFNNMSTQPLPQLSNSTLPEEYLGKKYNQTIDATSYFAPFQVAYNIILDMFKVMLVPSLILSDLGVPGSNVIGLVLNLVFWIVTAGAIIEIFTKMRGV